MKIQTPPGMRDFYPEDMRLQNWLFDRWREASRRFGFQEYEGPIFEFLDLYRIKSGDGIVNELFHFTDRGDREFAIRPEMTPSLARMVAARANGLARPIKWFSIPRMCRAERPQRGRLREFFQWNVDVLGVDDALADAEVMGVAASFLRSVGLSDQDVAIRFSHRRLAALVLASIGVPDERVDAAFGLLDKMDRMPAEKFDAAWGESIGANAGPAALRELVEPSDLTHCLTVARDAANSDEDNAALDAFDNVRSLFPRFGIESYATFDLRIVRGLAYYTGTVFEAHTRKAGLRALLGGGRYDDLTAMLDGPAVPGVGFGMGDVPVFEALRELGKLPDVDATMDVFVVDAAEEFFADVLALVAVLRDAGMHCEFSYKRQNVGKQLKQANARKARCAIIVGNELPQRGEVAVKELGSGEQRLVSRDALAADPRAVLSL